MTGTELALVPKPLFRELRAFRERMGYGGEILGERGEGGRRPARRVALEQRLGEVRELLAAPGLPRPADAFAAYTVLVNLCFAVDNKYFGPCDLSQPLTQRPICQPPEFFSAARSPTAVIGLLPEFAFLLDHERGIELAQRSPGNQMPFEPAADDRFAPLKQYAWREARPFPSGAPQAKRDRIRQFFVLLQNAPAPEDRLQSHALVNWLFGMLEGRHRALRGASEAGRMYTTQPFVVYQIVDRPDADVLLTTAHALIYHGDGTVEMYARDTQRDVKDGRRTVSVVLARRDCRLRGRPRGTSKAPLVTPIPGALPRAATEPSTHATPN